MIFYLHTIHVFLRKLFFFSISYLETFDPQKSIILTPHFIKSVQKRNSHEKNLPSIYFCCIVYCAFYDKDSYRPSLAMLQGTQASNIASNSSCSLCVLCVSDSFLRSFVKLGTIYRHNRKRNFSSIFSS